MPNEIPANPPNTMKSGAIIAVLAKTISNHSGLLARLFGKGALKT